MTKKLTGDASPRSPQVTEILLGFDAGSLPQTFENLPGDDYAAQMLALDWVSVGGLADPIKRNYHKWVVTEESELGPVVDQLFDVVDGPLMQWAAERSSPEALLSRHRRSESDDPRWRNPVLVRRLSTLALVEDDVDAARWIVRAYQDPADSDTGRITEFERQLAARFPRYGSLQLSPVGPSDREDHGD